MASDWEYGKEHGLWGEDGIPYFIYDSMGQNYYDDYEEEYQEEPTWFATAEEAQDYAKKHTGTVITRSPDGNGYIIKK